MEQFTITGAHAGQRLDHALPTLMPAHSRRRIQEWIEAGRVLVDGRPRKASYKLRDGERVDVDPVAPAPLHAFPEEIPFDVLYEDSSVIAVNKPAGLVVHAGAGRHSGTLVNALLHRYGTLSENAANPLRPGIVHRLDKGTSGVLLVARHDEAHRLLAAQFADRQVEKTYLALVRGAMNSLSGVIDKPIARDPAHRTRMSARVASGREAHTEWRVLERFARFTLLEVGLGTGRTHQIRVHLSAIGHPVAGDPLYGAAPEPEARPFLHAWRITFFSPGAQRDVTVEAPLPPELEAWKQRLL